MRILILGATGMLGHALINHFQNDFEVFTTLRNDVKKYIGTGLFEKTKYYDFIYAEDTEKISLIVDEIKPEVIINAIGVIKQLPSSKNVVQTLTLNSIFPHLISDIANRFNSRFITIGTDCVFDGKKGNYTEVDESNATDLYGRSKNLGEVIRDNCLTIRTSIIGRELETNHSLVEWFLSQNGKTVKGYRNGIYSGFPTKILSEIISKIITEHPKLQGLYHISSEPINKFDLLHLIKEEYKLEIEIEPFSDFRIDRSLNSDKFRKETGFKPMDWASMIKIMAEDNFPYNDVREKLQKWS